MKEQFAVFLKENEGKTFYTVTGLPFTYELRAYGLYISRVKDDGKHTFTYTNLYKALDKMPVSSPFGLNELRGPSYCYAIIKAFLKV